MRAYKWVASFLSASLLALFSSRMLNADVVDNKGQTKEEIKNTINSTSLILMHSKQIFKENKINDLAGHSSHSSHASHASHSSHYSSPGSSHYSSATYTPSTSSTQTYPYIKPTVPTIQGIYYSNGWIVLISDKLYGLNEYVCGGKIINISQGNVTIKFKNEEKSYKVGDTIVEGPQ